MKERRFLPQSRVSVRLEKRDGHDSETIVGTGAVFYDGTAETEFELFSMGKTRAVERILPSAFDRVISEKQDVRGLFNHDPNNVLGRTQSGTMRLSKSKAGLEYEIDPGDTTIANDVREHLRRGDVTGSSFAFTVEGDEWEKDGDLHVRNITDVDAFDFGPVTYPAYEATSAGVRSLDAARSEGPLHEAVASWERWQQELRDDESERAHDEARVNVALKT